ncbi:MAG TPA: PKD domain-containing protein [Cyclobacteriaceae bacterium]|jgi:hypothetical protein|nr:PKD domain-containing protein [Cyclobacteriaceae bacterium]
MKFRGLLCGMLISLIFNLGLTAGPGINFIENKGQWPGQFDFTGRVSGGLFAVGKGAFTFTFINQKQIEEQHLGNHGQYKENPSSSSIINGEVVTTSFLEFNPNSKPQPFGLMPQYYNYFLGSDKGKWKSLVHAYEGVFYNSFYPGIDLKVYSEGINLKYDFILEAGADPSLIQWQYKGVDLISFHNGDIEIKTPLTDLIEKKPIAYQFIDGKKVFIRVEYKFNEGKLSFNVVDKYDHCLPLVIDPLLIFSTYSGSTADNWGSTATPGEHGTLYSSGITALVESGYTLGGNFPATPGAFQTTYGGLFDVAILKYDSTGSKLLYASYLGGLYSESPHSLVIDKDENLLVLGTTSSSNFPITSNAFQKNFNGGISIHQSPFNSYREIPIPYENGSDIFVTKISKDGTKLLASTYLGGSNNDGLNPPSSLLVQNYGDPMRGDIISDQDGNIFISTVTASPDFPLVNGFNTAYKGGDTDALILKLNSDLSQLVWGTFLGGSLADASHTIKFDNSGNLFVAGGTASANFPTTPGSYQPVFGGNVDGWISKISGDGSSLLKSTFTGTSSFNQIYFLDLDKQENVYVYGQTVGTFPVTSGVYRNANSGQFLQKFDNSLSTLSFSTVFGSGIGIPNISPTAFLVNDCNNIYLSGWGGALNSELGYWNSSTQQMPVTPDAFQKTTSGSDFYFIVLSSDATKLLYATYLGGVDSRTHLDGGTCRFDKSGVVYHAVCSGCSAYNTLNSPTSDFPTTANAWSRVNGSKNCNNAAFKFDLASLKARIQTNSIKLNQPNLTHACVNDKIVFQNLSTGGQTYDWNLGDGSKQAKTDTSQIIHQYLNAGKYTVRLKATDLGTCAGKDSTSTYITIYSPLGIAGPDQIICFDAVATLQASGGTDYLWATSDKSFTSSQASPSVSPKKETNYFITITDQNGCVKKDTVTVDVVPGIDLKLKAEQIYDCESRPVLNVTNLTDSQEEVFFDFGDGSISDQQQTTHQYVADGKYVVRLVGKKEFCIYDTAVTLPFFYRKVPNVFTPEGSPGLNDTFMIQYGDAKVVPGSDPPIQISLKVYNRWGKLTYQNNNYKNDWAAKNVEGGVYYFEATIAGETTCKSWVTIIK